MQGVLNRRQRRAGRHQSGRQVLNRGSPVDPTLQTHAGEIKPVPGRGRLSHVCAVATGRARGGSPASSARNPVGESAALHSAAGFRFKPGGRTGCRGAIPPFSVRAGPVVKEDTDHEHPRSHGQNLFERRQVHTVRFDSMIMPPDSGETAAAPPSRLPPTRPKEPKSFVPRGELREN